jgi:Kyakuja-Dileera-Zisupton transposase
MIAFDGNESLKHLELSGDRTVGDTRIFTDSDYYLELSFVDPFTHEVKSRQAEVISTPPGDGSADVDDDDVAEEPTEDDATLASCADNWKAARSDSKKRMWGIFRETGLFASACHHSLVLWIADMIHSGEQYVYSALLSCYQHGINGIAAGPNTH